MIISRNIEKELLENSILFHDKTFLQKHAERCVIHATDDCTTVITTFNALIINFLPNRNIKIPTVITSVQ